MSKQQNFDDKQVLTKLTKDFHELVTDKGELHSAIENFLQNVVDELTLGVIFDLHRKYKTNSYEIEMEEEEDDEDSLEMNIFLQNDAKKPQNCVCPNCNRAVAAAKFASHLETCMGMGRVRVIRNATRRETTATNNNNNNNKERENLSFSDVPSDNEDDIDWNSGNRRGRKKKRNGTKKPKGGGTPKKSTDARTNDLSNIEIEVDDDDELVNLKDVLQDHSNSSSPADSVSSTYSNPMKRDRSKNKKIKRDRRSPSSNISLD